MKILITNIQRQQWGQFETSCEPSDADIMKALSKREYETRGFQEHEAALTAELFQNGRSEKDICQSMTEYHARRVAYFVEYGWNDAILLSPDGVTVMDGSHRLRAAIYKGEKEIDCEIHTKA